MKTTDAQVRVVMEEYSKHGKVGRAALKAGVDRKTAAKYLKAGKLPSQMKKPRTWRTREDPFEEHWEEVRGWLEAAPELEAKALFEYLQEEHPGIYEDGQLRTFQRRVKEWRAQEGPDKEIFFAQEHKPGEAMQTDFTCGNELGVRIAGEAFRHLLCHPVLPYSNWGWVTVCRSESMAALRRGVQEAVFRLGKVAEWHQTDNSTAATHDLASGKRGFNRDYEALMKHLGMRPRTIAIGESHQNGDAEALNGALKRRLEQHLLLRGSRDFESVADYEAWVQGVVEKANHGRQKRLRVELAVMRPLSVRRLPEYSEEDARVSRESTIRVKRNTYTVPSRLRDERVRVRIYDDRLEVYHGQRHQQTMERLRGEGGRLINYRHVIEELVRKPGAFARYRYRAEMFPAELFRRAHEVLVDALGAWPGDLEYLRVLRLAARTMQAEVETALELVLEQGELPKLERVRELVEPERPEVPEMEVPEVDLVAYDGLIGEEVA